MKIPLECAFQDVKPTEEIKDLIADKANQLERVHAGITSCRVHIRAPHKRQRTGKLYEVTVEVRIPGATLTVRADQNDIGQHEHLAVAVRDAFSAMARKLNRKKQTARGDVKVHEGLLQGKVAEINHAEGYGQIAAVDHRLIYFHENSVVGGIFETLNKGDAVELVVQTDESEIGPQASTVRRIGSLQFDPD